MFNIYKNLEKEVDNLESLENWNDKSYKMTNIKDRIAIEQQKLNNLINSILKNEVTLDFELDLETGQLDLETLILKFKKSENFEDKLKYYYLINNNINEITRHLFTN
jgi:hypothetical protein